MKRTTLELGGKSPNIVFDDCDFEKTAITSLEAVYMNAGQCCCAGTRGVGQPEEDRESV